MAKIAKELGVSIEDLLNNLKEKIWRRQRRWKLLSELLS